MPITALALWAFSGVVSLALVIMAATKWGLLTVLPVLLVGFAVLRWAMAPVAQPTTSPVVGDDRTA